MPAESIVTEKAPAPIGPYSQAIRANGLLITSGQIAIDPAKGEFAGGSIEEQTRQVLKNLKAILDAGGTEFSRVVKTTVFLKDINDFKAMNEVYAEYFGESRPARSTVQAAALPAGASVEIDCIALCD